MQQIEALGQAAIRLIDRAQRWRENPSPVWGLPTGFPSWDLATGGLHDDEVTVLGARDGQGKTSLAMQLAFQVADHLIEREEQGDNDPGQIVIVSPEMSLDQLLMRHVSARTGIKARDVKQGRLDDEDWEAWKRQMELVTRYEPFITITAGESMDVLDVRGMVEELHSKGRRVSLVIIDYLQLLTAKGASAYERVTNVSRYIKVLNLSVRAPVLVLARCHRPADGKGEERPYKYELSDSGDIEYSASNVFMLYNPAQPGRVQDWRNATVYIDKHRDGPEGYFNLRFFPAQTRFEDHMDEIWLAGEPVITGGLDFESGAS